MKDNLIETLKSIGIIYSDQDRRSLLSRLSNENTSHDTTALLIKLAYTKGEMAGTKDSYSMVRTILRED